MKTDELKALGLSDDQVQRVFALHGEDVNGLKTTIATLTAERDTARTSLGEANKKLEGYDPDWKQKAADAQQQAEQQIAGIKARYAAASAADALKFTSESAKKAFLSDLAAKKLPLQDDGKLLGFDDFVKSYKESDPGALRSARLYFVKSLQRERPRGRLRRKADCPRVSGSATGTPATPTTKETGQCSAARGIRP